MNPDASPDRSAPGPIAITGANRGLGLAAARWVAERGHAVALLCRSEERGRAAAALLPDPAGPRGHCVVEIDLASLASVRRAAERVTALGALGGLVNNAAVIPQDRAESRDGFELQLAVTHLGHFLLTALLTDALRRGVAERAGAGGRVRVATVSSGAHHGPAFDFDDIDFRRRTYGPLVSYQQSKLANVLFTLALARRVAGTGLEAVALSPGVWDTALFHDYAKGASFGGLPHASPIDERAGRIVGSLVAGRADEDLNGAYMSELERASPSEAALGEEAQERLWAWSEQAAGISPNAGPAAERAGLAGLQGDGGGPRAAPAGGNV